MEECRFGKPLVLSTSSYKNNYGKQYQNFSDGNVAVAATNAEHVHGITERVFQLKIRQKLTTTNQTKNERNVNNNLFWFEFFGFS